MRSYIFDKKEKGVFDLLKNCISNDCTRKNLCYAYYDGNGSIYATDGRRLVKISSKRLIEKLEDKLAIKYPTTAANIKLPNAQSNINPPLINMSRILLPSL